MMEQEKRPYVGYEYKKITVAEENASWYLDCYESFGWEQDDNAPPISGGHGYAFFEAGSQDYQQGGIDPLTAKP